jgi:hypothetical protein
MQVPQRDKRIEPRPDSFTVAAHWMRAARGLRATRWAEPQGEGDR